MNTALLDPFILAQDIPDTRLAKHLRSSGNAVCLRFNRQGDLLASGTSKGGIAIFDLETYGIARKLRGHTPGRQVSSISWSGSGRYLLSAAVDWRCILWDLEDGTRLRTVNLGAAVFNAELHPLNHLRCVAALFEEQPIITDLSATSSDRTTQLTSAPKRNAYEDEAGTAATRDAKHFTSVALFHPSGEYVFTGTTKGWLNIISTSTGETIHSLRLASKPIVSMRISASGTSLLANSADTIIRTLRLPDFSSPSFTPDTIRLEVEHKFQDVVNRLSWNSIALSPNDDYVMASTFMNHDIYIWERTHGSLVKILEGPKEELGAVDWHPTRPSIAACGVETGRIYVWAVATPQKWSALAPDFAEVEENVEYVEREDEFDILEAGEVERRREGEENDDVDVLTVVKKDLATAAGKAPVLATSAAAAAAGAFGDGETDVFRMPVLLDIDASDSEDDMVHIGAGQYRRKNSGPEGVEDEHDGPQTNGDIGHGTKRRRGD